MSRYATERSRPRPPSRLRTLLRWLLACTAFLTATSLPNVGGAQETSVPNYQLQRFRPATGPTDYLGILGSAVPGHLEVDGGLVVDFANNPLKFGTQEGPGIEVVDSQSTASLTGNIGLFDRAEVGILLPITFLQSAGDLSPLAAPGAPTPTLNARGLNDVRIGGTFQVFDLVTDPAGLAFASHLNIPVGTRGAFTSDGTFGAEFRAIGETWLWRGVRVAGNLGYRYRANTRELGGAVLGDEFMWGAAASIPLLVQSVDLVAELDGAFSIAAATRPAGLTPPEIPTEVRFASRIQLVEGWSATFGLGSRLGTGVGVPDVRGLVGISGHWVSGGEWTFDYDDDGIIGSADECPESAEDHDGFEDADGCPDPDNDGDGVLDVQDECPRTPEGADVDNVGCIENDSDGDGIPDDEDECPEDPEDFDDYEDADGCPDPDNDDDGIPDLADECPNAAETFNDFKDDDGCPDEQKKDVDVVGDSLVLNKKILFETAKATLQPESYDVLDTLAERIESRPELELIRIEGYTDSRGDASYNRNLSQRRAESVRNYLVDRGISPQRLVAKGFGEQDPVATNETEEGRRKNRRVEFKILETREE